MKRVAIAGATGAVGTEMLKTLEKRNFPVSSLKLLASERSVGRKLVFKGKEIAVELRRPEAFDDVDIVLSSRQERCRNSSLRRRSREERWSLTTLPPSEWIRRFRWSFRK